MQARIKCVPVFFCPDKQEGGLLEITNLHVIYAYVKSLHIIHKLFTNTVNGDNI
ncbi:hypothetical protein CLHUN_16920 [Ruminiclostridium hungatei]|uniref:Uncharacterized protein n=1 Tax=Ruminiclostridium hungatei TaxID=48256 RepID=A0A1V4SKS8_RUMHU|nr:hypothetical protein CLHUN_16920 [Ruminiclostridium hungatei]